MTDAKRADDAFRSRPAPRIPRVPMRLQRSRALNGRLMDDQKGMIGALQVFIQQAERYPDDGPMQTFKDIAIKRIASAVQVP